MKKILYICLCSLLTFAIGCNKSDSSSNSGNKSTHQGGSMARFTISGNQLYTVDQSKLRLFDISDPGNPKLQNKDQLLNSGIETIFSMDTLLFIGSQSGMYIFNITRPDFPQQISFVEHIRACDPVVASGTYAYVTLNSNNFWCGRRSNALLIFDINNPYLPVLKHTQEGFLNPKGLGVDGNKLFICDNGVKVYDINQPTSPIWIDDLSHIPQVQNIKAYDLIPQNGILIVSADEGLFQFDYTGKKLRFLSKIEILNN